MGRKRLFLLAFIGAVAIAFAAVTVITPEKTTSDKYDVTVISENLDVPWGIEFLPEGDILVTERPGTLTRIEIDGNRTTRFDIEGVAHRGEGGLQGIEKHPDFSENNWIYLYMTTRDETLLQNRVVRYTFEDGELSDTTKIISGLPGAPYHDGGRIEFGPDGKLYITAGDATNEDWAQRKDKMAGKILRINEDGSIPEDNPFDNPVYSYGHRNPQGLTWINDQLWSTEHGRSGLKSGMDELNSIEKRKELWMADNRRK